MMELTKTASEAARAIAAETDTRAACGFPAPNAFETLALNNTPQKRKPIRKKEVALL